MSSVVAQSLHVFGLRSHVTNNIFFFDEQTVMFPSGNHCVKYNVDQKWQKFIPGKALSILEKTAVGLFEAIYSVDVEGQFCKCRLALFNHGRPHPAYKIVLT